MAVNARYSHCAFAARSLLANLGVFATRARLLETDLEITPLQLVERIVAQRPKVIGFSVYLWNTRLIENTAQLLRVIDPQVFLVAGGPEFTDHDPRDVYFDALIIGEGETIFRELCAQVLESSNCECARSVYSQNRCVCVPPEDLSTLRLPYHLYSDADLAHRIVYVEASRGCPYFCTYCTSAGTGLRLIPLDTLLPALETLWKRGLRRYKFLDRTFNAAVPHAVALLDFFLARVTPDLQIHLEINPEGLSQTVYQRMAAFPAGCLHLEVGIQTLNPQTSQMIGRGKNPTAVLETLERLTHQTGAMVHADLIFGLPGEDEASFAQGFNTLLSACHPPEVQVNLLKGLPGTHLATHATELGLAFNSAPPYELLYSDEMDFATLMRIQNFARCWELVHNRGRFPHTLRVLHNACHADLYSAYQDLANRLLAAEGKLFAISLPRLARLLAEYLSTVAGLSPSEAKAVLTADLNAKPG